MADADLAALDQYLDALRTMPNEVGAQVRAMDAANTHGLPPLEVTLAAAITGAHEAGESERDFLISRLPLTQQPALAAVPHADAGNRLYQAVANLKAAGLWPW